MAPESKNQPPDHSGSHLRSDSPLDSPSESQPRGMFFMRKLPLETETAVFFLANVMDVLVTYILLNFPQFRESNAIANHFFTEYGFRGMVYFKFAIVAIVIVIAQIIAARRLRTARWLLNGGSLLAFAVVIYSLKLFRDHLPSP